MKDFRNQVAAITGAGSGIGRALAGELARAGCHLALADINPAGLDETRAALGDCPVTVSTHTVDVSRTDDMQRFADETIQTHGRVNLLINNAGITLQKSFASHTLADWERVIGINLWGVIHGCHAFLPHLRAADAAHIVNLSSMAGFAGLPTQASYCATKAAVRALNETLWVELRGEGIGVTGVHPGAIRTPMIQATLAESDDRDTARRNFELAQKWGLPPDKAARHILRAVRRNRQRVRVGPDSVLLDVLKRLLPTAIHRPMARLYDRHRPV